MPPIILLSLSIFLVIFFAQGAFAHTYLSSLVLDGTALAQGDCVRPHASTAFDSPISLVTSPDMTCGFLPYAALAANRKCPITAGARLGIQWHHNNNGPSDDILDPSHKGPVIFYLSKTDDGSGSSWFKIYEDGYTADSRQWATDRLIGAGGLVTIIIPADVAPGNYLLRGEILALHQGQILNGVQPYVGCAELAISGYGSGSGQPPGVAFPGAYSANEPGLLFNLYTSFSSYPIPGPALYVSGYSSSTSSLSSSSSGSPESTTVDPTSPPTNAPTNSPTNSPTNTPTSTPTSAPILPPSSTGSSSVSDILVHINPGSSVWWLGVRVSGGSQTTAKVEIIDSGSVSSWTQLVDMSYAYVFDRSIQLKLPISLRLTSTSDKQVTLTNIFTSWSPALINTGEDYSRNSSPSNVTPSPTSTLTSTTTSSSTSSSGSALPSSSGLSLGRVTVTVYPSASKWWFACTVSGSDSVASVEFKDSTMSSYALMRPNQWAYTLEIQGWPFVAPVTIRVTNEAGQAVTVTVASITPGLVASAN